MDNRPETIAQRKLQELANEYSVPSDSKVVLQCAKVYSYAHHAIIDGPGNDDYYSGIGFANIKGVWTDLRNVGIVRNLLDASPDGPKTEDGERLAINLSAADQAVAHVRVTLGIKAGNDLVEKQKARPELLTRVSEERRRLSGVYVDNEIATKKEGLDREVVHLETELKEEEAKRKQLLSLGRDLNTEEKLELKAIIQQLTRISQNIANKKKRSSS